MPEGPIAIDRLVDAVARLAPLERLPREAITSTRHGAQLLVDQSESMAPYAADQAEVESSPGRNASNAAST